MVALPEKYVYGWLFGINSGSDALQEYQYKCFEVLYDYFHGTIGQRHNVLAKKAENEKELRDLEKEFKQDQRYQRMEDLRGAIARSGIELKELDRRLVDSQLSLFNQQLNNN